MSRKPIYKKSEKAMKTSKKIFLVNIPDKHDILLVCTDHCCGLHDTKPNKVELSAEMEEKVKNNVIIKLGEWHTELIRKHYPEPSPIQCEEKSIELVFKELREMVK